MTLQVSARKTVENKQLQKAGKPVEDRSQIIKMMVCRTQYLLTATVSSVTASLAAALTIYSHKYKTDKILTVYYVLKMFLSWSL
jgi:hypothetical protein